MNLDINDALNTLMFGYSQYYQRIADELPSGCNVVEVGCADGISAIYLAQELHKRNKTFKLYMIDNMDYGKYEQMKTIYTNIIKSGLGEYIEVIPKDSVTASKDFNDGYIDFLFLDSSHEYQETKDSIHAWFPKIKDGCILSGHDFIGHPEVYKAVTETIPLFVTRNDIPDRVFDAERFLLDEVKTDRGYGIWECRKDFYKKLNP